MRLIDKIFQLGRNTYSEEEIENDNGDLRTSPIGKYFRRMFRQGNPSLTSEDTIDVHCQYCDTDITELGGDVSGDGRIYCHEPDQTKRCSILAFMDGQVNTSWMSTDFYRPDEVQNAIRDGTLGSYLPLESRLDD